GRSLLPPQMCVRDRHMDPGDVHLVSFARHLPRDPRWSRELRARVLDALGHGKAPFLPPLTATNISGSRGPDGGSARARACAAGVGGVRSVRRGGLLLGGVAVRGVPELAYRGHDLMQRRHHLARPLAAEPVGVRAGPVDAFEAGGQLLLDPRDLLRRITQLGGHPPDIFDVHTLRGVRGSCSLFWWLAPAPVPVHRPDVVLDRITVERGEGPDHGEESPWG